MSPDAVRLASTAIRFVGDDGDPEPPPQQAPQWAVASCVKGETESLRQHANEIKRAGRLPIGTNQAHEPVDTSMDGPWHVFDALVPSEYYKIAVMVPFLLPQLIMLPALLVLMLPPVAHNFVYFSSFPEPMEAVPRNTKSWRVHCVIQWLLSVPVQITVGGSLLLSTSTMTVFGAAYATCVCGWGRYWRNQAVIAPYQGGPSLYWHFGDCVAAAGGMAHRQGLLSFCVSFSLMFLVNPWLKYWVSGNVFLDDLGERFITQIGQRMDDMNIDAVDDNFRKAISRAKNVETNRQEIEAMAFCPHYPYPPEGRRFAIGMQKANPGVTTFVHTTHFRSAEVASEGPVISASSSAELPVYRVVLWRNNPYHIFTGLVEANISNGLPSQPNKKYGAEHPMWLVNAHTRLAASRCVNLTTGWIDIYFDEFIPYLGHFIRLNVLGREAADAALENDPKEGFTTQLIGRGVDPAPGSLRTSLHDYKLKQGGAWSKWVSRSPSMVEYNTAEGPSLGSLVRSKND